MPFPQPSFHRPRMNFRKTQLGVKASSWALWDNPRRTPTPCVVFLCDTKARSYSLTLDQIREDYLRSLKPDERIQDGATEKSWLRGTQCGARATGIQTIRDNPLTRHLRFLSKTEGVLFIQMNASSQLQLDS